jgi:hypothetical protein
VESSGSIVQDAASQASLTVEAGKPEDLAANPIEWMATAPPQHAEEIPEAAPEWSAADTDTSDSIETIEADNLKSASEPVVPQAAASASIAPAASVSISAPTQPPEPLEEPQPALQQKKIASEIPDPHKTQPSLNPLAPSVEDTAHSIPKQEWADLAASLQTKPVEPVPEKPKPTSSPEANSPAVPDASAQPAAVSVAPIFSAAASNALSAPANSAPSNSVPANSGPANSAAPAAPDPALVEAVVQRILEKMRPQVVDIITKEFLRPIVQALVHREIEKH